MSKDVPPASYIEEHPNFPNGAFSPIKLSAGVDNLNISENFGLQSECVHFYFF